MPLIRPRTTKGGLPGLACPPDAGSGLQAMVDQLNSWRGAAGPLVRPGDDLQTVINQCNDGDTITLLPGTHQFLSAVTVDKRLRIVGVGATIQCAGTALILSGTDAEVLGVQFRRTGRTAAQGALLLSGNGTRAWGCTVQSAAPAGVRVEGDYCAVQDCKFLASASAVAGDSDVYWADGATFGICCGSLWGRTAGTFALDYRAIDQMTEAANGVAAIINVR